jgi:hypothetical protein
VEVTRDPYHLAPAVADLVRRARGDRAELA